MIYESAQIWISFAEQEEELASQQAPLAAQDNAAGDGGGGASLVVVAVGVPRLHVPEQGPARHLRHVRQEQKLSSAANRDNGGGAI